MINPEGRQTTALAQRYAVAPHQTGVRGWVVVEACHI